MGFLKFLKRDKGKEPDLEEGDLDMPPMPPDFQDKNLGDFPELPELPEIDEPFSEGEEYLPELEFPEKPIPESNIQKAISKPEFRRLQESTNAPETPPFPKPMFGTGPRPLFGMRQPNEPKFEMQEPQPIIPKPGINPYERLERAAVREERGVLKHKDAKGPIFIRVDKFREIINGAGAIRNNLKLAGQSVARLEEIDANRDNVFDKWHIVIMDLQKKLIFIDKTLFKR
ncbi:MAG: hypothetical protein V1831_02760 [Candidatus Woesearchaeota archaeon]